ncbi:MAG: periplasmic heavy metal sensor [Cypionkella sp.]
MNDSLKGAANSAAVPPTASCKWTRRILVVSLAVNLGVAGLALGAVLHHGPGGHGDMVRNLGFGPYDDALRPEDRMALKAALRSKAGDLKAARVEFAGDAKAILAALRADPFDVATLGAALTGQRDHFAARMKLGSETMGDYLAGLPKQDRLDFADRLENQLLRKRRGGTAPPVK